MGRQFTNTDRAPLCGKVVLASGQELDVNGGILSEEGRAAPGEPSTRSRQCRIVYYKLPDDSFVCRTRHAGKPSYEWKVQNVTHIPARKTQRLSTLVPVHPVHVLNGADLCRVVAQ